MYDKLIIVRYGEIGVKSRKVRGRFERKLIENIKTVVDGYVKLQQGRIFIYPHDMDKAIDSLQKIPGIVSFSPADMTQTDHSSIKELIETYIGKLVKEGIFSAGRSRITSMPCFSMYPWTIPAISGSKDLGIIWGSISVMVTFKPICLSA